MDDKIDYSLYDNKGKRYVVRVDAAVASSLAYDNVASWRLLSDAKKKEELNAGAEPRQCTGARPKVKPPNDDAEWTADRLKIFFALCEQHRHMLRKKQRPIKFWEVLSASLNEVLGEEVSQCPFKAEQLRDKFQRLKKSYRLAQKGELNGIYWEHYTDMHFLLDSSISISGCSNGQDTLKQGSEGTVTRQPTSSVVYEAGIINQIGEENSHILSIMAPNDVSFLYNEMHPCTDSRVIHQTETEVISTMSDLNNNNSKESKNNDTVCDMSIKVEKYSMKQVAFDGSRTCSIDDDDCIILSSPNNIVTVDVPELEGLSLLSKNRQTCNPWVNAPTMNDVSRLSESLFSNKVFQTSTPDTPKEWPRPEGRSPFKKQPTSGVQNPRSPATTPKRKSALVNSFPEGAVEDLVKECLVKKEKIQLPLIPNTVWHAICVALRGKGHTGFSWQSCRDKFGSLNDYFSSSMLKTGGMVGGFKWPYYDNFCLIHDIPKDYVFVPDESGKENDTPSKTGTRNWDRKEIENLLSLYKEKRDSLRGSKSHIRHDTIYHEMALSIPTKNAKQCKNKLTDLLDQFRKEFDKQRKSGSSPTRFEWYEVLLGIEAGSSNLNAPYAYSVGAAVQYSRQGVNELESTRSSRGRPSRRATVQPEEEDVDDPGVPVPANNRRGVVVRQRGGSARVRRPLTWSQEVQHQTLQSRNDLVGEVRMWREQANDRGGDRNNSLSVIATSMRMLAEAALAKSKEVQTKNHE